MALTMQMIKRSVEFETFPQTALQTALLRQHAEILDEDGVLEYQARTMRDWNRRREKEWAAQMNGVGLVERLIAGSLYGVVCGVLVYLSIYAHGALMFGIAGRMATAVLGLFCGWMAAAYFFGSVPVDPLPDERRSMWRVQLLDLEAEHHGLAGLGYSWAVPPAAIDTARALKREVPELQAAVEYLDQDPFLAVHHAGEKYYIWAWDESSATAVYEA